MCLKINKLKNLGLTILRFWPSPGSYPYYWTLFEQKEKDYYKLIKVGNFWNNNYIEYESSGDKNKNLSVK